MANKRQFVVIGLGRFGESVAKTLFELGHDVLAIDRNEDLVQEISPYVTHAVQLDTIDESALKALGLRNFDVAVVTIGSEIQASVMATLILKELGVKYIIAKANSELHAKVLYKIGADKVVLPEKDMGKRVAHNIVSASILDYIEVSQDYSIMELKAPSEWRGKSLKALHLRSNYGINVVAIKNGLDINISPIAEVEIKENDIIVAIGSVEALSRLETIMINQK